MTRMETFINMTFSPLCSNLFADKTQFVRGAAGHNEYPVHTVQASKGGCSRDARKTSAHPRGQRHGKTSSLRNNDCLFNYKANPECESIIDWTHTVTC